MVHITALGAFRPAPPGCPRATRRAVTQPLRAGAEAARGMMSGGTVTPPCPNSKLTGAGRAFGHAAPAAGRG